MFGKLSMNYFVLIIASVAVSAGVMICKDIPVENSNIMTMIAENVGIKRASKSPDIIAKNILPPDVFLEGGKEHYHKRLPEIAA